MNPESLKNRNFHPTKGVHAKVFSNTGFIKLFFM